MVANKTSCATAGLIAVLVILLLSLVTCTVRASGPPFTQCPAIGKDTSCGILITFNPDGNVTIQTDSTQGPFDGSEDTLVGVQNNSTVSIPSVTLSSPGIFGFDEDGLATFPGGKKYGPTGYEGPNTSFSPINADNGTVNFTGGLPPGKSRYFSLETAVNAASIDITIFVCQWVSDTRMPARSGWQCRWAKRPPHVLQKRVGNVPHDSAEVTRR
jgi:hypothetical protein